METTATEAAETAASQSITATSDAAEAASGEGTAPMKSAPAEAATETSAAKAAPAEAASVGRHWDERQRAHHRSRRQNCPVHRVLPILNEEHPVGQRGNTLVGAATLYRLHQHPSLGNTQEQPKVTANRD
jgi:hypothetical protein